jgi:hypothetical protein
MSEIACVGKSTMSKVFLIAWALEMVLGGSVMATQSQGDGPVIPRDLMTILLEKMGGQPFDLRVGAPPSQFPADLLPAGTTVVATAMSDYGTTVVGIASAAFVADALKERARLIAAGWLDTAPLVGFVANDPDMSVAMCRGDQFAVVDYRRRLSGGIAVRAVVAESGARPCVAWQHVAAGTPLPVLLAPDGASISQGRGGAGADGGSFTARVVTSLGLSDLTAHYVKQLESQGWKTAVLPEPEPRIGPPSPATTVTLLTPPVLPGDRIAAMLRVTQVSSSTTFDIALSIYRCNDGRGLGMPCGPRGPS